MARRLGRLVPLVLVALLALSALASASLGCRKQAKVRDTLVVYIQEPAFIDPYNAQESEGVQVVYDVFDSLVDFDPLTSEIEPSVAETWSANADFTVWTFKLRKGTKFHNGREVKAGDFVYAWNRIASPADKTVPVPSDVSYHLSAIKGFDVSQQTTDSVVLLEGLKAVDDYTLEVTLSYPFADFQYVVGHPALAPVPKEAVEGGVNYTTIEKGQKVTKFVKYSEMPVGNGPFKLTEPWKHNQYIKVERFDDYWGDKAKLSGVEYRVFKDDETAFLEFKAGNVDFTKNIPTGQIRATASEFGTSKDGYTASPGASTLLGAETSTYYINANNRKEFLDDPKVRAAISLAIDRKAIADTVFEGVYKPATGLVPPGVVGFEPDQGRYTKTDPKAAKELLAEAGYPDGKGLPTFDLEFNTGAGHEKVMEVVESNLADIGIKTDLKGMEWAQFIDYRQAGKHELARDGWVFDYPIIDNMLYPLFHSDNIGQDNTSGYKNVSVDALILEARKTADPNERARKYSKAENLILDDAGAIPIAFYGHRAVAQKYVKGLVLSPLQLVRSHLVSFTEPPPAR